MSTYVMSDIHGCYTEYMEMLEKIKFDPKKDEVIIAGDIVDRGPENLEMLRYMQSEPESVTFLMGNHDFDFAYYCRKLSYMSEKVECPDDLLSYLEDPLFYIQVYDPYDTVKDLIKEYADLKSDDFLKWGSMIMKMPYYTQRRINDRNYLMVHAGYIEEDRFNGDAMSGYSRDIKQFYIWARNDAVSCGGKDDTTIVFGHTPTIIKGEGFYNEGKVWYYEDKAKNRRFINIDCGLVYGKKYDGCNANLACIRLDDEKVFYLYGDM